MPADSPRQCCYRLYSWQVPGFPRCVNATSKISVVDGNGLAVAGVTVAVSWKLPSGKTLVQTASTTSRGLAAFTTTDIAGTYSITVTGITKTGYTFDATHSVLTKTARSR